MKKFNLNDVVKVKLTDYGKDIYYHRFDRLIKSGINIKPRFPKEDEDGFSTFQLWCFIELYGPHMHMTSKNVIEHNDIYFFDSTLEEIVDSVNDDREEDVCSGYYRDPDREEENNNG